MKQLSITLDDVKKAQEVLKGNARRTPLVKQMYLTSLTGGEVFLKMENMQLTGSFKFRGAYNKINSLTDAEKAKGIIACSAGNHAQGCALSGKLQGIEATIVMPTIAPKAKIEATESYGAKVVLAGDTFDEAHEACDKMIEETGLTFCDPYDDPFVMAGQGTIGLEILEDCPDVEVVVCPIGGGGLISGIAMAIKSQKPDVKIIGVQADNVHGMKASFDAGKITKNYTANTLADGCNVATPGTHTFDVVEELVEDIVTVSEEEIALGMKTLLQRAKAVNEGSGALPTAAILSGKIDKYIKGKKVVAIVSGGNVDLKVLSDICLKYA
ncbi:MAG: bifunctional threonine ammonia-lyase/L-serine ammonia-lyase TdcB [Bacilli bacterium]|jgi:threonine dehydratase|nr:bifunctional threonine ammonia-lyase/L-serine ammonia-lyase TdcB [Bacilli bacterium]